MALFVVGCKTFFLPMQYLIDSQQKHKNASSSRIRDGFQSYILFPFLKTLCTRPVGLSVATFDSGANINGDTFKIKWDVDRASSISRPAKSRIVAIRLERLTCSHARFQA